MRSQKGEKRGVMAEKDMSWRINEEYERFCWGFAKREYVRLGSPLIL